MPRSRAGFGIFRAFQTRRAIASTFTYHAKGSTSVTVNAIPLGGVLLVSVLRSDNTSTASLTGTLTGTFTRIATQVQSTTGFRLELWVCTNYGTAGGTVTPNTAGTVVQMIAVDASPATVLLGGAAAIAQFKAADGNDNHPFVTFDAAPTAECYYFAQLNSAGGGNGTPDTGYSALTANNDFYGVRHGYRVVAAGSTAGLTAGASGTWCCIGVEIQSIS